MVLRFYLIVLMLTITPTISSAGIIKGVTDFFKHMTQQILKETKTLFRGPEKFISRLSNIPSLIVQPFVNVELAFEGLYNKVENLLNTPSGYPATLKDIERLYKAEFANIAQQCNLFNTSPTCSSTSLYRSFDGTCNNINHPKWGSVNTADDRLLPAAYSGLFALRQAVDGNNLPTARSISLKLVDKRNLSNQVSALFTFFGQSIAHDITSTPVVSLGLSEYFCLLPFVADNATCGNLAVGKDDPFFSKFNINIIPFPRSAPFPKCTFEKRTPLNQINSFIDVSLTYGNDVETAKSLRLNDGSGRLKTQYSESGDLLPQNTDRGAQFCPIKETTKCFQAGEPRVNQHVMLMALHTLFLRWHNVLADILRGLNPQWNEEVVYQETRRLVIAIQQYIIYNEYLPLLVGNTNMKKYNLNVDLDKGSLYDDQVQPGILAEFATASFRLHSMVPRRVSKYLPDLKFDMTYGNTDPIHEGNTGPLVAGSCEVASEQNDRYVREDITNNLYRPRGADFGGDLTAIDIQRGRDNGLPPYVDVVKECQERKVEIQDFPDLSFLMDENNIKLLRSIYTNVADIDLWVGLILETSLEGSVLGPTASCLNSIQFNRLKYGDSFFFTHNNIIYPFTNEQLQFIKKLSMAQLICETAQLDTIRRYPFLLSRKNNPLLYCNSFPPLNLEAWKAESN